MSSLLATIRNGRFYLPESALTLEGIAFSRDVSRSAADAAYDDRCIRVNAQSVFDDMRSPDSSSWAIETLDYRAVPAPITPPYESMWIEATFTSQRVACILRRFSFADSRWIGRLSGQLLDTIRADTPAWVLCGLVFVECEGAAMFGEEQCIWLAGDGKFHRSWRSGIPDKEEGRAYANQLVARCHTAWIVHTLARFNCANVRIEPVSNGKAKGTGAKDSRNRGTVWHTIVVGPALAPQSAGAGTGRHVEVRSHWVRGHYADYTKGAGLFGRESLRAIFWVPEHQRGNESVGRVISDYKLARTRGRCA
jgi:hypothetical protein